MLLRNNGDNLADLRGFKTAADRKGLIFNIQRYSIHDGPGIRTTVFLKGCPLRCRWCSNPESISPFPEILIRNSKCDGCRKCVEVCPREAIIFTENGVSLDRVKCDRCMKCVEVCHADALEIAGRYANIDEILDECSRDDTFYRNSGGGVTLSGGEPLLQADFAINLLKECKSSGLGTALDTSGYIAWETLQKALQYTDILLFDIKHLNAKSHREGTGVDNSLIINNLEKLMGMEGTRVWIRIPVIPGYNNSENYIEELAGRLKTVRVEKISLLGYHEWGKQKYEALGRDYTMRDCEPLTQQKLQGIMEQLQRSNLEVTIGY